MLEDDANREAASSATIRDQTRHRRWRASDRHNFDRYWMDAPPNAELLGWSYPAEVTRNNLRVGAIMTDFLKWYRASA